MKAIIIMGSKKDFACAKKIEQKLKKFGIKSILQIASAHKSPLKVLNIIKKYENENNTIFITVAGRNNALSGLVDFHTKNPVIACPNYDEKNIFSLVDILSTLRTPSGIAPLLVLEPEQAAIAAAKILAVSDEKLKKKIQEYHNGKRKEVEKETLKR